MPSHSQMEVRELGEMRGFNSSQYKLMKPRKPYVGATEVYSKVKLDDEIKHQIKLGCTRQKATIRAKHEISKSKVKLSTISYDDTKTLQGEIIKVNGCGVYIKVDDRKIVRISHDRIQQIKLA